MAIFYAQPHQIQTLLSLADFIIQKERVTARAVSHRLQINKKSPRTNNFQSYTQNYHVSPTNYFTTTLSTPKRKVSWKLAQPQTNAPGNQLPDASVVASDYPDQLGIIP